MKNEKEVWVDVKGYEGIYIVSSSGRVKALSIEKKRGRFLQLREEVTLSPSKKRNGYLQVVLCKNSKRKYVSIHRIVADSFIDNPHKKPSVNHKNGIKTDNSIENLEWSTGKEQINHADTNGLRKIFGENSKVSILKDSDVLFIRNNFIKKSSAVKSNARELMSMFNISETTLYNIVSRRTWKHI